MKQKETANTKTDPEVWSMVELSKLINKTLRKMEKANKKKIKKKKKKSKKKKQKNKK